MSHKAKQLARDLLAWFGVIVAAIGAILFVTDIKATAATKDGVHDTKIAGLEAAIGEVGDIKKDIVQIKIDAASTKQLLHDLAEQRFQYDTRPSERKAMAIVASSTMQ